MIYTENRPLRQNISRIVVRVAFLVVVAGCSLLTLQARQVDTSPTPNLSEIWNRTGCMPNGFSCPFDLTALPLTARANGFRQAFDEVLGPKYDCVQATIPSLIVDPYNFRIEQMEDRIIFTYEKDDVVRTVWLEGHGHPDPGPYDSTHHGYSKGSYENGELTIETTKFLFDPTGLDDLSNVPSSTLKRVVERYSRAGDLLNVEVTVEDPLMLTEPVRFTYGWERSQTPLVLPYGCDTEVARQPTELLAPMYLDPGWVRLPAPAFEISQ